MTLHPKFEPKFLTLKTFEGLGLDHTPVDQAAPEPSANRQPGHTAFNNGSLKQYLKKETELPLEHRFATLVDRVVTFAHANAPNLKPPMSEASLKAIKEDFGAFKNHITIEDHFGPHNQEMFSFGKEIFSELSRLLENDKIELHSKMNAITAMSSEMPMCSGGVMTAVQGGVMALRYSTCGFQGAAQLKKEALVAEVINNFIENNHDYDEGNHVHYVNAYFNHMAADLGLPERNDPLDTVPQNEITKEMQENCKDDVTKALQPVALAMALAESYLGKLQGAACSASLDFNCVHDGDSLKKLCKVIDEINHAVLHNEFGEVPQACYLQASSNGDDTLFAYRLAKRPDLIAKHFVEKLKESNLIDHDKTISLSVENDTVGSFKMLSSLMWIEHGDERLEADAQDLLVILPTDMAERLKEQKIGKPGQAEIFKIIGEQVLNEVGAAPQVIGAEWAEKFVQSYKNVLPPELKDMQQMLKHTAYTGNLEMLEALLKHEVNPDACDISNGHTPLMFAANGGHTPVVARLLKAGANVNLKDYNDTTAAMAAASSSQITTLEWLIDAGANLDVVSGWGETALLNAAHHGNLEVIQCLVRNNADINIANSDDYTPLMIAIICNKIAVADFLITKKADLDSKNNEGYTALAFAAEFGLATIVTKLIDNNADINACSHSKTTPSIEAAAAGHVEVLKILMAKNANLDARDENGQNAAFVAASSGHADVIKILIEAKKEIREPDHKGRTPLMAAAGGGHVAVMQQLINAKVDIDVLDQEECTALMRSCLSNQLDSARCLIKNKAKLDIATKSGNTALILAIANGFPQLVEALVGANASIEADAHSQYGTSPLMVAAEVGNLDALNILIKAGVNLNALNSSNGCNAAAYAVVSNQPAILERLIEVNIKITGRDKQGYTLAMIAADVGAFDVLKILINNRAALNETSTHGSKGTCLHMAIEGNQMEAVALLAHSKEIDLDIQDFLGCTPLLIALRLRKLEAASLLIAAGANVKLADNSGRTPATLLEPQDVELREALAKAGVKFG